VRIIADAEAFPDTRKEAQNHSLLARKISLFDRLGNFPENTLIYMRFSGKKFSQGRKIRQIPC
jgi:hypothetical protein